MRKAKPTHCIDCGELRDPQSAFWCRERERERIARIDRSLNALAVRLAAMKEKEAPDA